MGRLVHAYYSSLMAEEFGTVFYMGRDGRKTAVTLAVRRRRGVRRKYRWDDLKYVGRVWESKVLGMDDVAQAEADLDRKMERDHEREEMQRLR